MRLLRQLGVGLIVVVLAIGCDRGTQRDQPADSAAKTTAAETTVATPPKAESEKAANQESCKRDADCRTYFRCFDQVCIVPPAVTGEERPDTAVATFSRGGEDLASFKLELARTNPEKTRGLMFRRSMKDDWGMLFVYPGDGLRSFWMKDTLIPLDMVFITSNGEVVSVIEGAEPMTLSPRRSEGAARYVLELNAGIAELNGIGEGTVMRLKNAPEAIKTTK